jgi:biotin/methionine sulfoxide reductase
MAIALAALLGQLGLPGGGVAFGLGTFNDHGAGKLPFRWSSFPQGRNPVDRLIPVARIADMLLHPGDTIAYNGTDVTFPEIGLIYWAGGNPFHHHQDLHRLAGAFRRPATIVVNDAWFQPTARFADIVLPATTPLERNDFAASAHGGFASPMHKAAEPYAEARSDFDIFTAMAERMGFAEEFTEGRDEMAWVRHLYDQSRDDAAKAGVDLPDFDAFWSNGWIRLGPLATGSDKLAELRAEPATHPLATPSGKVELVSETIAGYGYDDCGGHPMWFEPREWLGGEAALSYPLHLLSDQPRDKLHSQLDSGKHSAAKKINGREPIMINPDDAALRGIADGDIVQVFNARGRCLGGAVISDRVMPGVVVMSTGAWMDVDNPGDPESLERHGNPNVLTYDAGCSSLSQGPSCNTTLVEVEPYRGNLPPVEAHDIPLAQGGAGGEART